MSRKVALRRFPRKEIRGLQSQSTCDKGLLVHLREPLLFPDRLVQRFDLFKHLTDAIAWGCLACADGIFRSGRIWNSRAPGETCCQNNGGCRGFSQNHTLDD